MDKRFSDEEHDLANNTQHYSVNERYINSAVKLSNCFANQVNILTKLQAMITLLGFFRSWIVDEYKK